MTARGAGVGALAATGAAVATLLGLAANQASSEESWPGPLDWLREHPWPASGVLTVVGVALSLLLQRLAGVPRVAGPPPPATSSVPAWIVARTEATEVIAALCARQRGTVGITTALEGAGGFGKTTLAEVACADRKVRRRFRGRVFVVTVGREVRGRAALAAKVAEATRFITGDTTTFDDPALAGAHLGRLLDQRGRTLLVLDDVWEREQLEPFLRGGRSCVRLVTTRIPKILPTGASHVRVDAMSREQAREVLTWDLPPLPRPTVEQILAVTGRWPLLLRLANRLIAADVATGADPAAATRDVLDRLRAHGPVGVDPSVPLELDDPRQRRKAVQATVESATRLLPAGGALRFAELGVFAEDEAIPVPLVARLWHRTGGRGESQARELIRTLANLSLLTLHPDGGGFLTLHDVIRDYLRRQLGRAELAAVNVRLVDAAALGLPAAAPLAPGSPSPEVAWWDTPHGYALDHLISHLIAAGRTHTAEAVAGDLRWIETRLHQRGASAARSDLAQLPSPDAQSRARDLSSAAHLLMPADPQHALADVLYSRLGPLPAWRDQVAARQRDRTTPSLVDRWDPPDLFDPALRSSLIHSSPVRAVAIGPDGTWLVGGCANGTFKVWDTETLACVETVAAHAGVVTALAVAADGSWLVTGGADHTAKVWDTETWKCLGTLAGHTGAVTAVAISPDGTLLVTASADHTGKLWDPVAFTCAATLAHHTRTVTGVAFHPDGTQLVTCSEDEPLQRWNTATGRHISAIGMTDGGGPVAVVSGGDGLAMVTRWGVDLLPHPFDAPYVAPSQVRHIDDSRPLAIASSNDGTRLVTAELDQTAKLWNVEGEHLATVTGHVGKVNGVTFAHDGSWFATACDDETIKIWDTEAPSADEPGRSTGLRDSGDSGQGTAARRAAITPDGSRLVTLHPSNDLRIWTPHAASVTGWDVVSWEQNSRYRFHAVLALSPDGRFLAECQDGHRPTRPNFSSYAYVYDLATLEQQTFPRFGVTITALAIAPNRSQLVVGDMDGAVTFWDPAEESEAARTRPGHTGRVTVATMAPDGSWVATGGEDKKVKLWNVATRRATTLAGHTAPVTAIAVASDGTWLATGAEDGSTRIWDRNSGVCTAVLTGHTGRVTALSITPDGHRVAVVTGSRTLHIWDRATSGALTLMRTEAPLLACAWTGDGHDLIACGSRGLYGYRFHPRGTTPAPGPAG
ncbi:NB-ARC domain-containing protein [Streptomyces sp. NPDC059037]|uniref:NB-ARC domain-containing protein n=1 Tax=Streptomyces sp. NPDC059037 TaxID=3346710 RepID=UPI0036A647FB